MQYSYFPSLANRVATSITPTLAAYLVSAGKILDARVGRLIRLLSDVCKSSSSIWTARLRHSTDGSKETRVLVFDIVTDIFMLYPYPRYPLGAP